MRMMRLRVKVGVRKGGGVHVAMMRLAIAGVRDEARRGR